MKKALPFIMIFWLMAQYAYAQSWEPVQNHCVYNYRKNGKDPLIIVKPRDSVRIKGNIVYTIAQGSDYCVTADCYAKIDKMHGQILYLYTPAGPFKTHYLKQAKLRKFTYGPDSNLLKPFAMPGDSWAFSPTLQAKVINKSWMHYLDFDDSVKTVLLGTYDTILLSKQYGILKYPLFNSNHEHIDLVGIEPGNHGFHYPYAQDIFNYNIGDSFEYSFTDYSTGFDMEFIHIRDVRHVNGTLQWKVAGKEVLPQAYKYRLKGYLLYLGQVSRFDTSVTIYFGDNRFRGDYAYDGLFQYGRYYGRGFSYDYNTKTFKPMSPGSDTLLDNTGIVEYVNVSLTYLEGLGCTDYHYDGLTGSSDYSLTAYRKGRQRSGGFKPIDTSSLKPLPKPITETEIKIGPVPVSGTLHINYQSPAKTTVNISIADINGKVFIHPSSYTFTKGTGLINMNMNTLPDGVYFLRFDGEGISRMFKIVVLK